MAVTIEFATEGVAAALTDNEPNRAPLRLYTIPLLPQMPPQYTLNRCCDGIWVLVLSEPTGDRVEKRTCYELLLLSCRRVRDRFQCLSSLGTLASPSSAIIGRQASRILIQYQG